MLPERPFRAVSLAVTFAAARNRTMEPFLGRPEAAAKAVMLRRDRALLAAARWVRLSSR